MVKDDGMEMVALFVLQLREGGSTPTMVDDDGVEVVAALFVLQLREGGGTSTMVKA